jgi:pyruvate/2-oxoglutarate dehydrogenase complex dihydrolipoamide acyltransferase (E2) component
VAEFPIRIPKASMAVTEATFLDPLVAEGQAVEEGQPLYLLETDKVEQEIAAPASGVVHWTGDKGETYEVGTQIGHIATNDS